MIARIKRWYRVRQLKKQLALLAETLSYCFGRPGARDVVDEWRRTYEELQRLTGGKP